MQQVDIYVKTTCPFCWRAKSLLQSKGIEYREIVVDFGGPVREEMIQRANGRTTVPQIFFGSTHVGGCDDLMALERAGRIEALLEA